MFPWFRFLLIWLMVAALPVQGWAAAAMVHCGPSHHRMAQAVAGAADHTPEEGLHHAQGSTAVEHGNVPYAHGDAQIHVAALPSLEPGDEAPLTQLDQLSKFKCSACAFCCTSAAPPADVIFSEAVQIDDFVAPLIPRTVPVFLTDGPDRPPRTFLL
ncbi:MAG: hypothetical protein V4739_02745 [Pseudomonadota bacterium]